MWTVDHEADIASDLSAFHRVDDVSTIDGPRYFSLAQRLSAYSGVMGAIVAERARRENDNGSGSPRAAGGASSRTVVSDDMAIASAPEWIEHVKAGED